MTLRATIALLGALVFATVAAAAVDDYGKQQIRLNATDNAAASSIVLRKSDLGGAPGWSGGAKKPDLSSAGPKCANFNPKYSDLVLTGVAETEFHNSGVYIDSEAQVLQTPRMVKLDWNRSVLAPGLLPCLQTYLAKSVGTSATVHAIKRLRFPRLAQYTAAFRLPLDVPASGTTVRMMVDLLLVGQGRTEVTLTTIAPWAARGSIKPAEVRLGRLLASRIRA